MSSFENLIEQFSANPQVKPGKFFGKPCLTINKKTFLVQFGNNIAFKLAGDDHTQALEIEGAELLDPRGNGRVFKEWVDVPQDQSAHWSELAEQALSYVEESSKS
jgi:hypothetical protein